MPDIDIPTGSLPSATPFSQLQAKRTEDQRESDYTLIAELLGKKNSITEIHKQVNASRDGLYSISRSQIVYDIRQLEKRWAAAISTKTMMEWKAKELHTIELLEAEAMEAWERSKREGQSMTGDINDTGASVGGRRVTRVRRDGDPRWIEAMIKLQERKARLLGLDAPIRLDASVKADEVATLDTLRAAYRERVEAEIRNTTPRPTVVDVETVQAVPA